MLEKSEESVSEVAYKVGFNDPLYFSKKFKEAFGVSPSKFSEK
jgi:AraC-like DNA-binding protein